MSGHPDPWRQQNQALKREFAPRPVAERLSAPLVSFMQYEFTSGALLLLAALVALVWANSPWAASYHALWHTPIGLNVGKDFSFTLSLHAWINDLLMAVFFFVIGLEIKRELRQGELAGFQRAVLPIVAALGGMIAPALIYTFFNGAHPQTAKGWGIPTATDIAFAVGVLVLLGKRVPVALKVFLLAVAIADDLGAVLVIAVFYSQSVNPAYLAAALGFALLTVGLVRLGVRHALWYLAAFAGLWLAMFFSGVHATIAGVVMGFLIPMDARYGDKGFLALARSVLNRYKQAAEGGEGVDARRAALMEMNDAVEGAISPLHRLEGALHPTVSFLIMPLFALANAGISFDVGQLQNAAVSHVALGVALGLVLGKPVGVTLASWLVVRLGVGRLPQGVTWGQMAAVSLLAGVGFTMAMFVTGLSFGHDPQGAAFTDGAKVGILAGSLISAVLGLLVLRVVLKKPAGEEVETPGP